MTPHHLKAQQQVLCGGLSTWRSAEEEQELAQLMQTHTHTQGTAPADKDHKGPTQHGQALVLCPLSQLLSAARGATRAPDARAAHA